MKRQFDLSHLQVDERLQYAHLATFQRRAIAFAIDWGLIALATSVSGIWVFLMVAYLVLTKKFTKVVRGATGLVGESLHNLDQGLAKYDIEAKLRQQFGTMLRVAIYVGMTLLLVVPVVSLGVLVADAVAHDSVKQLTDSLHAANSLSHPLKDIDSAIGVLTKFLGAVAYFTFFPAKWDGQTPGKRLMQIKVVKLNGKPLTKYNCFERASGYASSASMLLMGFFQYFWDKNHQTSHDKLVETVVIEKDFAMPMIGLAAEAENELTNAKKIEALALAKKAELLTKAKTAETLAKAETAEILASNVGTGDKAQ
jgi:uncharacterized RDD family membrane protein YckC